MLQRIILISHAYQSNIYMSPPNAHKQLSMCRIAEKFGGESNLVVWRSILQLPNLKSAKLPTHIKYVWQSRTEPPNLNPLIFLQ